MVFCVVFLLFLVMLFAWMVVIAQIIIEIDETLKHKKHCSTKDVFNTKHLSIHHSGHNQFIKCMGTVR